MRQEKPLQSHLNDLHYTASITFAVRSHMTQIWMGEYILKARNWKVYKRKGMELGLDAVTVGECEQIATKTRREAWQKGPTSPRLCM